MQQVLLLDTLLNATPSHPPSVSAISSLLLFGPRTTFGIDKAISNLSDDSSDMAVYPEFLPDEEAMRLLSQDPTSLFHITALRNAIYQLKQSQRDLSSTSSSDDQVLVYRELTTLLQDIGDLLAIGAEPAVSYSVIDVSQLLLLSVHMLAILDSGLLNIAEEDILGSLTYLCGAFFSSSRGIQEVMSAFEDIRLEQAWQNYLLGNGPHNHDFIAQLRCAPGVWSVAEEIRKVSLDIDISPSFSLSRSELGVLTTTLLDSWRTSQVILQLQLGDMEHIRRHSEVVSQTCLDLAKLCAYDSCREVGSPDFCTFADM